MGIAVLHLVPPGTLSYKRECSVCLYKVPLETKLWNSRSGAEQVLQWGSPLTHLDINGVHRLGQSSASKV